MYSDKIYLTPQEILDKEFKIDARGYRPQEVDKFLDMVIRDYTEFINIIIFLIKTLTLFISIFIIDVLFSYIAST